MPLNEDFAPPQNETLAWQPVVGRDMQDQGNGVQLRTYFLPDQRIDQDSLSYSQGLFPVGMAPLHVPRMVRFIYTYRDEDAVDDLCDAEADDCNGGSTPGPTDCVQNKGPIFYEFVGSGARGSYTFSVPGGDPFGCEKIVTLREGPGYSGYGVWYEGPIKGIPKMTQEERVALNRDTIFGACCDEPAEGGGGEDEEGGDEEELPPGCGGGSET